MKHVLRKSELKAIESLGMCGVTIKSMSECPTLVELTESPDLIGLNFKKASVCTGFNENLSVLQNRIGWISLYECAETRQFLEAMPQLPRCEMLWVGFTTVSHSTLQSISRYPRLRDLTIHEMQLAPSAIADLRSLIDLESLAMSGQAYSEGVLEAIHSLNLSSLAIGDSELDASAGPLLGECKSLRFLDLRFSRIHADVVEHLRELPELTVLRLSGSTVSDESVIAIGSLHSLEALDIDGTQITDAGAAEIRKLLPDCEVRY